MTCEEALAIFFDPLGAIRDQWRSVAPHVASCGACFRAASARRRQLHAALVARGVTFAPDGSNAVQAVTCNVVRDVLRRPTSLSATEEQNERLVALVGTFDTAVDAHLRSCAACREHQTKGTSS